MLKIKAAPNSYPITLFFYTHTGEVLLTANVVLWAVKPQIFPKVVATTSTPACPSNKRSTLHISVMAGISLDGFISKIQECPTLSRDEIRHVRVMPNLALRCGAGCAGKLCISYSFESKVSLTDNS